ncbi:MAG: ABC transporter ATP-binding protein [Actinomycetota bacterium]|nr:ABC transporter ATP-binding protein [Actinomycetota bacterium]
MSSISLENVRIAYNGTLALAIEDLHILDGELLVVLGPSGSGKTTLLRAVAGLDSVTSGTIRFGDEDVTSVDTAKRGVAMVFQRNTLYPFKDVRGNVAFPLEVQHRPADEVKSRVEAEARVLEIEHLLSRQPNQLGAGHQQLVQAARALVQVPQVFLMDEPFARLDAHLRFQMRHEFRLLQQGYGVTTLFVTNDQDEAMVMADRIVVLDQGRIRQVALPMEIYERPASKFVAQFVGSPPMRFVPARVTEDTPGFTVTFGEFRVKAWIPALEGLGSGGVDVGLRPEDIVADPSGAAVTAGPGSYLGSHGFVQLQVAPGSFVDMRTSGVPPTPGSTVRVRLRRIHLFHPESGLGLGSVEAT